MTAAELLTAARSEGIQLALVDGRLTWTADRQPPDDLLMELAARKVELIATLSAANDPQTAAAPTVAIPRPIPAPTAEHAAETASEPLRIVRTAATATPEWRAARDHYLAHIMTCQACHAPTSRHCPTGADLRDTYNATPLELPPCPT